MIDGANHLTMVRDDRYWPQVVAVILEIVDEVRGESEPGLPDR